MSSQLGTQLRQLRRTAGLTQQQAADLAGLSVASLRDLEQGRVFAPRAGTLRRLAEALQLSMADAEELLRWAQPGRVPDRDWWLQVLGPLRLRREGVPVELGSLRQQRLLGVLALAPNTPIGSGRLISVLWDQPPPANAPELLRIQLSRLRRRLAAQRPGTSIRVTATGGGYQLTISGNQLDLLMFRDLAAGAQRAGDPERAARRYAEALALWRGDPLSGLARPEWPELAGLRQEWRQAVVEYAAVALATDQHRQVLPLLRQVVASDPLHEAAHAHLVAALVAAGALAEAQAVYDGLRIRLVEELGTDPGPELRAAAALLTAPHPRAAPVSAYRQLPPDLADFTGRSDELAALRAGLRPASAGGTAVLISAVEGMAGVGKTRLAVHLAHQLLASGQGSDLQLYVDLQGHSERPPADPAAVLGAFLRQLGVPGEQVPAELAARSVLFRDRLYGVDALLLLDNAADEEQVRPLLPAGPTNLVLVTSRRTLALDGARVLPLDVFAPRDAQELLARVVGSARLAAEPAAACRIVQLCGHLPLAVSLAARRLRARPSWRLAEFADRLAAAGSRLDELAAGSGQLSAVFDLSYQALGETPRGSAAQRMFRLMGLPPGGELTAESAGALAGVDPAEARQLLDQLVDEHLATMVTGERYRLHDLLRDYAAGLVEAMEPAPARAAAVGRLVEFYLYATARATDLLIPHRARVDLTGAQPSQLPELPDRVAALRWLDAERAGLLAMVGFAADQGCPGAAWQLGYELRVYLGMHGYARECVTLQEAALLAVRAAGDRLGEVVIRSALASAYLDLGRNQDARDQLERGLLRYRELPADGDVARGGTLLNLLGVACKELGDFSAALRHYEQVVTLCAGRDAYREAAAYGNVATLLVELGRLGEARERYHRSLLLTRQVGDSDMESLVLANLGETYSRLGEHHQALSFLDHARSLAVTHGYRPRQAYALHRLGCAHHRLGRLDQALRYLHEAWQMLRIESGDAQEESELLVDLGSVYCDHGDADQAVELLQRAAGLAAETGSRYQQARALAALAALYRRSGQAELAQEHDRQARERFRALGVPLPANLSTGRRAG